MIARHCPTHGDVIPVGRRCPWGCDHDFPPDERREVPATDPRIELPALLAAGVLRVGVAS